MKRSIFIILAALLIIPLITWSQNEGVKQVAYSDPVNQTSIYSRTDRENAIIMDQPSTGGAPGPTSLPMLNNSCYLEPGWTEGSVMLSNNSILENINLRYDLYHQQLQFVRDDDTLAFANPNEIKSFDLGKQHFIYTNYKSGNLVGKGYFEVVADGKCDLLVRRTVKYHLETDANPSLQQELYIRECNYYLSRNGETAMQVKISKSDVLAALSDKQQEIKQYMDVNKIKMNSCEQLKTVVDYYNTLP